MEGNCWGGGGRGEAGKRRTKVQLHTRSSCFVLFSFPLCKNLKLLFKTKILQLRRPSGRPTAPGTGSGERCRERARRRSGQGVRREGSSRHCQRGAGREGGRRLCVCFVWKQAGQRHRPTAQAGWTAGLPERREGSPRGPGQSSGGIC